jgi:SAM-dependent methyltransferase
MDIAECTICGVGAAQSQIWAQPDSANPYAVLLCDGCGHGIRRDTRSFEENIAIQGEVFDEAAVMPSRRPRWPNWPALVARRAKAIVGDRGTLLDIGCGRGLWLSQFGDAWKRYGVDVSEGAADVARRFAGADVFCGPIEQYTDAPRSLDLITAFALIEHLSDPAELIQWARDHLAPGGLLILMTGDRESTVARHMGGAWPMYEPREHLHFFSDRSLSALVESFGFRVVRREWRHAKYSVNRFEQYLAKLEDIVGLSSRPHYDHLYAYARLER